MTKAGQGQLKVLYVTSGFPYPLTSGYLRHFHLIRGLAERGHRVTLLSLARRGTREADVAAMREHAQAVEIFAADGPGPTARMLEPVGLAPVPAHVRALADRASELLASGTFDVVLLSGKETYPVIASVRSAALAVDMCDATASRIDRTAEHASPARRPLLRLAARRLRRIERMLLDASASAAYASVRDREDTVGPHGRGIIMPNGVDTAYWQRSTPTLGVADIVLTGAMNYRPNVDAAIQLVDEVLPRVRRRVPGARAVIVGRDPVADLEARGGNDGIVVTGTVDDVRPYLDAAAVFAAPIRFGAGIQNKVLEAMAMGVPVVASPIAADGLRLEDGTAPPITICATPEAMADAIVDHLHAAQSDGRPHAAGREYVSRHFTWAESVRRLERMLLDAAGRA